MTLAFFDDYVSQVVLRTESPQPEPGEHWTGQMPLPMYRQHHATVGILTEVGEFSRMIDVGMNEGVDTVNAIEELGDQWWYTGLGAHAHGFALSALAEDAYKIGELPYIGATFLRQDRAYVCAALRQNLSHILVAASELLDNDKRAFYYRKPGKQDVRSRLVIVVRGLLSLGAVLDVEVKRVLTTNNAKLLKRYPLRPGEPGFNADLAVNRDELAERAALEGPQG